MTAPLSVTGSRARSQTKAFSTIFNAMLEVRVRKSVDELLEEKVWKIIDALTE